MNQQQHLQQNLNVVSSGASESGIVVMDGMQAVSNDETMQLLIGLNGEYHQQSQQQYQDQNHILCPTSSVDNMLIDNNYSGLVSNNLNINNDYIYQLPSFESPANTTNSGIYDINWGVSSTQQPQDAQQQAQMLWTNQSYLVQSQSEPQIQQQSQQVYLTTNHPQTSMVDASNDHQIIDAYHHPQQQPSQPNHQGYNIVPSQMQQALQTPSPIPTPPTSSPSPVSAPPAAKGRGGKRANRNAASKGDNKIQKPVSAYALFFRDTQASIKAENPSASFGEISKIVASKWEGLNKSEKDVYKGRADIEKKNYMATVASTKAKELAEQHIQLNNSVKNEPSYQSTVSTSISQVDYQSQESPLQVQQQTQSQQAMLSSHSPHEPMMSTSYVPESSNQLNYLNSYHHSQNQTITNHHHHSHHQQQQQQQQQSQQQPSSSFSHSSMNPVMSQTYHSQDQFCSENGSNSMPSVVTSSSSNEIGINSNCRSTVDDLNVVDSLDIFGSNNLMVLNLDLDEENITNLFGGSGGILSPTSGLDALDTNDYLNDLNSFADGLHELESYTDPGVNSNGNVFLDSSYNSNTMPNANSMSLPSSTSNFNNEEEPKSLSNGKTLLPSTDNISDSIPANDYASSSTTIEEPNTDLNIKNVILSSLNQQEPAKVSKVVLKIKLNNNNKNYASLSTLDDTAKVVTVKQEDKNICLRTQCNNPSIESKQWENKQFCSEECCVRYCSEVFQNWTQEAKIKNGSVEEANEADKVSTAPTSLRKAAIHHNERVSSLQTNVIRTTS